MLAWASLIVQVIQQTFQFEIASEKPQHNDFIGLGYVQMSGKVS